MKIIIDTKDSKKINLWLPSGPILINLVLKFADIDGYKFNKATRKKIIKEIKQLKKYRKDILLVDIETAKGEKVFVKI